MARIYVVEDDAAVLAQLVTLFRVEGYEVAGFSNPEDLLTVRMNRREPSAVVSDMRMPQISGLELQRKLRAEGNHVPIIFVSGESTHEEIVHAVEDPSVKYLLKPVFPDKLLETLRNLLESETRRIAAEEQGEAVRALTDKLTETQRRVFAMVLRSMSNHEIGRELDMKPDTVKKHRQAIFDKFGVSSVFQLLEVIRQPSK